MPTLHLSGIPNEKQLEFFRSRERHIAYGGARGGGKSWAMRRKLVMLALRYKGLNELILRRTLPELRENHVIPLMKELHGFAEYKATERVFLFPNGSRLKLGYCDSATDIYQYQGQEYDCIGLEEATHFTEEQMQFITTCNRTSRADFSPRMYYTCNPGNVGHAWVKRLFIDKDYRAGEVPTDYKFIPARVFDNTVLMKNNPEYVRTLEALPEDMRRAHLYGDWDVFAGQYFREFSREKHVTEPYAINPKYKRFRSMDWGYNDPCCVLWHAVDEKGKVITYRELYVRKWRAEQVAREVRRLSEGENIAYTVASPDMWQRRGLVLSGEGGFEGECIAEVFAREGIYLTPADNNRIAGWQTVRRYLSEGGEGSLWQCFSTCTNLIQTLPALCYDTKNVEDARDGNDHAPEALRYGLHSRPGKSILLPERAAREYDPLENEEKREGSFMRL